MRRPPDSEKLYELVGKNVGRRRREAKLSQTKLAKLCGLTRGSIANIELGNQRPTLLTLSTLAEALDVDMRSLLPARDELLQRDAGSAESAMSSRVEKGCRGKAEARLPPSSPRPDRR
ncbi:MAG: helix-turn-helix domain-containing protein [Acidimicrobiia bacterium]|nr:helix-turn-helix domain-containing protein [Acidimicrobiia bacterium]